MNPTNNSFTLPDLLLPYYEDSDIELKNLYNTNDYNTNDNFVALPLDSFPVIELTPSPQHPELDPQPEFTPEVHNPFINPLIRTSDVKLAPNALSDLPALSLDDSDNGLISLNNDLLPPPRDNYSVVELAPQFRPPKLSSSPRFPPKIHNPIISTSDEKLASIELPDLLAPCYDDSDEGLINLNNDLLPFPWDSFPGFELTSSIEELIPPNQQPESDPQLEFAPEISNPFISSTVVKLASSTIPVISSVKEPLTSSLSETTQDSCNHELDAIIRDIYNGKVAESILPLKMVFLRATTTGFRIRVLRTLGGVLIKCRKYQEALNFLTMANDTNPSDEVYGVIGWIHQKRRRYQTSIPYLSRGLKHDCTNQTLRAARGMAYLYLNKPEVAALDFEHLIRPDEPIFPHKRKKYFLIPEPNDESAYSSDASDEYHVDPKDESDYSSDTSEEYHLEAPQTNQVAQTVQITQIDLVDQADQVAETDQITQIDLVDQTNQVAEAVQITQTDQFAPLSDDVSDNIPDELQQITIKKSSKLPFTDPKYLQSIDRMRPLMLPTHNEAEWKIEPTLKFTEVHKLADTTNQVTHVSDFNFGNRLVGKLYSKIQELNPRDYQRYTFVLAGRKMDAQIPTESGSGRVMLILPECDANFAEGLVGENRDVMVVTKINDCEPASLGKPTARRLAALYFAWHHGLNNIMMIDDNNGDLFFSKKIIQEKAEWGEIYQYFQYVSKEQNLSSLSVKSMGNIHHKPPESNNIKLSLGSFGAKIFYLNIENLRSQVNDPRYLFPKNIGIWGGDVFFQYALRALNLNFGSFHRDTLAIQRSRIIRNSAQKSVMPAEAWVNEDYSGQPEYAKIACQDILEQNKRSFTRCQTENKRVNQIDLFEFTDQYLHPTDLQPTGKRQRISASVVDIQEKSIAKRTAPALSGPMVCPAVVGELLPQGLISELIDKEILGNIQIKSYLRDVQKQAFERALNQLARSNKGFFNMATGSGKTLIFLLLAKVFSENTTYRSNSLIVAPTIQICEQIGRKLKELATWLRLEENHIIVNCKAVTVEHLKQNVAYQSSQGNIVVMCMDSAQNLFDETPEEIDKFGLIIADEMHIIIERLLGFFEERASVKKATLIGFSATPGKNKKFFGGLIHKINSVEAVEQGIIAPWITHAINIDQNDTTSIDEWVTTLPEFIKSCPHPHGGLLRDNKGVIYVRSQNEAHRLKANLEKSNIKAETFISDGQDKNLLLQRFKKSNLNILVAVQLLEEGFDEQVDYVIIAKKTNESDLKQRRGRALRLVKNGKNKIGYMIQLQNSPNLKDADYFVNSKKIEPHPDFLASNFLRSASLRYPFSTAKGYNLLEVSSLSSENVVNKKTDKILEPHSLYPYHGGIENGGNTCFIASVLQIISVIPQLRTLFIDNPNDDLQNLGNQILENIESGRPTSSSKIRNFRAACLRKGLVEGMDEQEDAQEFLGKLLQGFNKILTFEMKTRRVIRGQPIRQSRIANSSELSQITTRSEFTTEKIEAINLEVSRALKEKGTANMQNMINGFLSLEKDVIASVSEREGNGDYFKRTYSTEIHKTVDTTTLPSVLSVNVKQPAGKRFKVDNALEIRVAGTKYNLVAILEHPPGHYVARIKKPNGIILEANDSKVGSVPAGFIKRRGCSYIYVKAVRAL